MILSDYMHRLQWNTVQLAHHLGRSEANIRQMLKGRVQTPRSVLDWLDRMAQCIERYPPPKKGD